MAISNDRGTLWFCYSLENHNEGNLCRISRDLRFSTWKVSDLKFLYLSHWSIHQVSLERPQAPSWKRWSTGTTGPSVGEKTLSWADSSTRTTVGVVRSAGGSTCCFLMCVLLGQWGRDDESCVCVCVCVWCCMSQWLLWVWSSGYVTVFSACCVGPTPNHSSYKHTGQLLFSLWPKNSWHAGGETGKTYMKRNLTIIFINGN